MPNEITGGLHADDLKFGLVVSRFNSLITEHMLQGCLDALHRAGARDENISLVRVPGAFEIPTALQGLARLKKHHALIALGAVIKGATSHDQHISAAVSEGIARIALESGIPIAFGVITPENLEQAIERAGAKMGNKGAEAATTAIEMANLMKNLENA